MGGVGVSFRLLFVVADADVVFVLLLSFSKENNSIAFLLLLLLLLLPLDEYAFCYEHQPKINDII